MGRSSHQVRQCGQGTRRLDGSRSQRRVALRIGYRAEDLVVRQFEEDEKRFGVMRDDNAQRNPGK